MTRWKWGTRWPSWLRHCATSRKVAGSIPDVIEIFHCHNPSGRTMALGLTQPLTEMSTRNISWGKGGRCVGLTTSPPSCAGCFEVWDPQPTGTLRAFPGIALSLTFTYKLAPPDARTRTHPHDLSNPQSSLRQSPLTATQSEILQLAFPYAIHRISFS